MKDSITTNPEHKTLPRINWLKLHLFSLYLVSQSGFIYATFKIYALAILYQSAPLAIAQNITLLALCAFFAGFVCLMATREPGKATFATVGAVLTALVV